MWFISQWLNFTLARQCSRSSLVARQIFACVFYKHNIHFYESAMELYIGSGDIRRPIGYQLTNLQFFAAHFFVYNFWFCLGLLSYIQVILNVGITSALGISYCQHFYQPFLHRRLILLVYWFQYQWFLSSFMPIPIIPHTTMLTLCVGNFLCQSYLTTSFLFLIIATKYLWHSNSPGKHWNTPLPIYLNWRVNLHFEIL